MRNTRPHTHFCPKCQRDVPCEAVARGFCLFPSTDEVTCDPCAAVATAPGAWRCGICGALGGCEHAPICYPGVAR